MAFVLSVIAMFIFLYCMCRQNPRDDSDPTKGPRSGLIIYTDHRTGLQYIKGGWFGGITPRLDRNGKHIGINNE